ncbi:BQ5605_C033g11235 [Microbotryum silenes-dioicae]|uniref:BQ5605_C033g11235 protein n=1 Tax=Microbotryum silenes-dioicae TaxID=796604 RepID=A0A2X0MKW5_9BASI|nr:BQ5605_C033g11235 [Microbotryum silenes-dioicae]
MTAKQTLRGTNSMFLNGDVQLFTPTVGPVGEAKGELPRCFMEIDDNDNNTLCESPPASEEEEMARLVSHAERDGSVCVVTDCTSHTYCWPVHIVPPSRHDVRVLLTRFARPALTRAITLQIWDKLGVSGRYELSAGLLLNLHFYTMFAHYAWSIYPLGVSLYFLSWSRFKSQICRALYMCFDRTIKTPLGKSPHGHLITRERFNIQNDTELPHDDLLRWHYRQCVLQHLRGIAILE